jgi:hypothetical protein
MNIFKPAVFLFVLILNVLNIQAQQPSSAILFKSGNYVPEPNIDAYIQHPSDFEKQTFENNWYGIFQFESLPTTEQKTRLTQNGLSFTGYIPNNAYVVSVPGSLI